MDRWSPPSLIVPAFTSLISALFLVFGYKMPGDGIVKTLFIAIGVVLAGIAFFTGMDWLIYKFSIHFKNLNEYWNAPKLHFAEIIQMMNPKQLDLLEAGGVMRIRPGGKVEGRLHWLVATPELDLPLSWIYEYLDGCEESFPDFLPQHGLSDNLERHRRRAFTKMMTNSSWGIAEWAAGNQAAHWLLPNMGAVRDALGMS